MVIVASIDIFYPVVQFRGEGKECWGEVNTEDTERTWEDDDGWKNDMAIQWGVLSVVGSQSWPGVEVNYKITREEVCEMSWAVEFMCHSLVVGLAIWDDGMVSQS